MLSVFVTLCFAGLKVLVIEKGMHPLRGTIMIPLNKGLILPPDHLELLMPVKQLVNKRVMMLAGVTDHKCQGEIELLFHSREYV